MGVERFMGNFDLLIGAYKNNLKITEVLLLIMKEKG